jgi:ERF superfamily
MRQSESIAKLAPALVKALSEIGGAAKGSTNPHFKKKYAALEDVIDASKDTLAKHGLALIQFPGAFSNGTMTLDTIFLHDSGEWISGSEPFGVATAKSDPQAVGSALTYARRYAQMAALNMPAVDDDGEAATRQPPQAKSKPEEPAKTLSLSDRANRFEDVLRSTKVEDLPKAWAKGSELCAQLDTAMPERLVELEELYKGLTDPTPFT